MKLNFSLLSFSDDNLNSYCNFIEYTCFVNDEMEHNEFDLTQGGLGLKEISSELERRLNLYGDFIPYSLGKFKVKSLLIDKT